jgi:hypothetical protein
MWIVDGLQGAYGHWATIEGSNTLGWVVTGNPNATNTILICSYLFVCFFALFISPICHGSA